MLPSRELNVNATRWSFNKVTLFSIRGSRISTSVLYRQLGKYI